MIQRYIEKQLLFHLSFQPAVTLLGTRQVGKTTLVKSILSQLPRSAIYLDLENPTQRAIIETDRELFIQSHQNEVVVLDEIQRLPDIFPAIRGFIDTDRRPGRFIFLGSASFDLLKNTSESLAGRNSYLELTPFLFQELPDANYQTHWLKGGYPSAYLAENDAIRQAWLQSFLLSYVEKDLPLLGLSANPALIYRLLTMLAFSQGGLTNLSNLSNSLGIAQPTLNRYVNFLEKSLFIRRLQPYFVNIGKRLVKTPKLYLRDSGVVHHLLRINDFDTLLSHPVAGGSWEGHIIEQIIPLLDWPFSPYFYRTSNGAELDLVISSALKVELAIEIKLSNNPTLSRGTTLALTDLDNPPLLVITPSSDDYQLRPNVWVCSLETLSKHLAKWGLVR